MTNTIAAVTIAGLTSGGIVATSAITGDTQIPLNMVAGVFVFVAGLVWTGGRCYQNLKDDNREIKRMIRNLPCHPMDDKSCPAKYKSKLDKLRKLVFPLDEETTTKE